MSYLLASFVCFDSIKEITSSINNKMQNLIEYLLKKHITNDSSSLLK